MTTRRTSCRTYGLLTMMCAGVTTIDAARPQRAHTIAAASVGFVDHLAMAAAQKLRPRTAARTTWADSNRR